MNFQINLNNTKTNGLEYRYLGQIKFWLVKYNPSYYGEATSPQHYEFKKYLGEMSPDENGEGSFEFSNDKIESLAVDDDEYFYVEARYYLDGEDYDYDGYIEIDGGYSGSKLFYINKVSGNDWPTEISMGLNFEDEVQNLDPDMRSFAFQFVKEGDNSPIANIDVKGEVLQTGGGSEELGTAKTDSSGAVGFNWEKLENENEIKVTILSYPEEPEFVLEIDPDNDDQQEIVHVNAGYVDQANEDIVPGYNTTTVANVLELTLSEGLNDFIADNDITTMRNMRKAGYLPDLEGYDNLHHSDIPVLQRINAQARMNLVCFPTPGEDPDKYIFLIDAMYMDDPSIASPYQLVTEYSATGFVAYAKDLTEEWDESIQPSDFMLASIYSVAVRQKQLSNNIIAGALADSKYSTGTGAAQTIFGGEGESDENCECDECLTAVSPLSYFSSLLTYAEDNLRTKVGGSKVNSATLLDYFYQPITNFKLDCETSEKQFCNFRIQIETLKSYSNDVTSSATQERIFHLMKAEFLEQAYKFILNYIGTEYFELKGVQEDDEKAEKLAERMGIPFHYTNPDPASTACEPDTNTIQELYFDLVVFAKEKPDPNSTAFKDAITDLEELLEKLFGLRKDTTSPLADIDDPCYLVWRRNFTVKQWEDIDSPEGEWITEKDYYIDPDIANLDDVRYDVDHSVAPVKYKDWHDTPVAEVLANRKKWSEKVHRIIDGTNEPDHLSVKGFETQPDVVRLDVNWIDNSITPETIKGTPVYIIGAGKNSGYYRIDGVEDFSGDIGVRLSNPLKSDSFDGGAKLRFQVGYPISSYSGNNEIITIGRNDVQYLSSPIIRLYNPETQNSKIVRADIDTNNSFDVKSDAVDLDTEFSTQDGSMVYFEMEVEIPSGSSQAQLGDHKIFAFHHSPIAQGAVVTIMGSESNNGKYEVDSVNNQSYVQTDFSEFDIDYQEIIIDRTASGALKSFLTEGKGSGELAYEKNLPNGIAYYSNGYRLRLNAHQHGLEDNDILPGDEVLFIDTASSERVPIAHLIDIPGTSGDSKVALSGTVPDSLFEAAKNGSNDVQILIDTDYNNSNQLEIPGRDLSSYQNNVEVYHESDYDNPISVTITVSGGNTLINSTNNPFNPDDNFYLAIVQVEVKSAEQTKPYFVLQSSDPDLGKDLIPGSDITIYDNNDDVIQTYTAADVENDDIIFVNELIEINETVNTLSYFPRVPVIKQFTLFAHGVSSVFDALNSSNTDFDYNPVHGSDQTPQPWDFTTVSDFAYHVEKEAEKVRKGKTSDYPDNMNLTRDAFVRFSEIYLKQVRYLGDPYVYESLESEELRELISILRLSVKNALIDTEIWKDEEVDLLAVLKGQTEFDSMQRLQDPRLFQFSEYAPRVVEFEEPLYYPADKPYLDGQFPLLAKLPFSHAGKSAQNLLSYHEGDFDSTQSELSALFQNEGVDAFVKAVYSGMITSTVTSFFNGIYNNLYSTVQEDVDIAYKSLAFMQLTQTEFEELRALREQWIQKQNLPEAVEIRKQILEITETSNKKLNTNPYWDYSEEQQFTDGNIYQYWLLKQDEIVPWLSSGRSRVNWINAVRDREQYVAVDPDLIDISYIRDINSSNNSVLRAFTLLTTRTKDVQDWVTDLPQPAPAPAIEKAKYYTCAFLKISEDELDGLIDLIGEGTDVSSRLAQLHMRPALFQNIIRIFNSLAGLDFDDVKDDLIDILVTVKKLRTYCEWKDTEIKNLGSPNLDPVIVSPIYFKNPVLPYGTEHNRNKSLRWRYSESRLTVWKRLYRGRDLTWENIAENNTVMIHDTEDAHLMILRDAYVELVENDGCGENYKPSLHEKAQLLSRRLLQDFNQKCCSKVTYTSTAISTLQQMFNILNEETDDVKFPVVGEYDLTAEYFEKEWKWLGGYESFRSAMFAFIYPENLLHPSLRKDQSPKFREITKQLNQGGVFTPESACRIATDYYEYMDDVQFIKPQAGANANKMIKVGACDDHRQIKYEKVFFGFAKGGRSNRLYYMQQEVDADKPETIDWIQLKPFGNEVHRIVGAQAAKKLSGKRYLYLFAIVHKKDSDDFLPTYIKYDLDDHYWDEEYMELDLPETALHDSIVLMQRTKESQPFLFFVKDEGGDQVHYQSLWMNKFKEADETWNWDEHIPLTCAEYFPKWPPYTQPIVVQELGSKNNNYHSSDFVVIYKFGLRGTSSRIILQPFRAGKATAGKDGYFEYCGNYRPGILYGVDYDFDLIELTEDKIPENNKETLNLTKYISKLGRYSFLGAYSSSTANSEFCMILNKVGNDRRVLKLNLQNRSLSSKSSFSDYDDIKKRFMDYFLVDLDQFIIDAFNRQVKNAWVNNITDIVKWGGITFEGIYDVLLKEVESKVADYHIDPTWKLISEFIQSFTDFSENTVSFSGSSNKLYNKPELKDVLGWVIVGLSEITDVKKEYFQWYELDENNNWEGKNEDDEKKKADEKFIADLNNDKNKIHSITGEYRINRNSVATLNNDIEISEASFIGTGSQLAFSGLKWRSRSNNIELIKLDITNIYPLSLDYKYRINPTQNSSLLITANKNSFSTQQRRISYRSLFISNKSQRGIIRLYSEAYYFTPILLAMKLHENGYYDEALAWFSAVYDYKEKDLAKRKIWFGLTAEEATNNNYDTGADWLQDPMNPHKIALTRSEAYTAFTIQSIVKCILDYADQEFTMDTTETLPTATRLYEEVEDLMSLSRFTPSDELCGCKEDSRERLWGELRCLTGIGILLEYRNSIDALGYLIDKVESCADRDFLLGRAVDFYFKDAHEFSVELMYNNIADFRDEILGKINPQIITLQEMLNSSRDELMKHNDRGLSVKGSDLMAESAAVMTAQAVTQAFSNVTGYNATGLASPGTQLPFTRNGSGVDAELGYDQGNQVYYDDRQIDVQGGNTAFSLMNVSYQEQPLISVLAVTEESVEWTPGITLPEFCVPDNPVYESYRMRAESNLFKIRNCMNIAGMKRELDPYAAPTDATTGMPSLGAGGQLNVPGQLVIKPTQYRYQVLIQRAKELIQSAQQLENVYLASLEKKDAETYTILKARQELKLSRAGVKLNNLKVKVSEGEVELAELQRERHEIQVEELDDMIQTGLNQFEEELMQAYRTISEYTRRSIQLEANMQYESAMAGAIGHTAAAVVATGVIWESSENAVSAVTNTTQATQSGIRAAYTQHIATYRKGAAHQQSVASRLSVLASQARREREWEFQKALAEHDIKIADQQIGIAQDRLRVSGQELKMAELQQDFAEDSLQFLQNKFTNAELYTWMSRVLGDAFANVLNEATATAKLAMYQLMFERQQAPPVEIDDSYWEAPSMAVSLENEGGTDRKGLTGSVRLLEDVTRMDQWAFTSNERKQEGTFIISMARMFPLEFEQFKQTGVITFNSLMEHFDRRFPGQYMRIIRRVRTNVVALVPPTQGISAVLKSSGISEVVIKGDRFQNTFIRRTPEEIAISTPEESSGVLELQPEGEQMMNPFEGNGVAMQWQFEMPKESNLLDYNGISDVLISIDYTALQSSDYKNEVLRKLPREYEAEKLFSFRNDFSDQFYELQHPEESETPYKVSFDITQFDFPGNLRDYYIRGLRIMLNGYSYDLEGVTSAKEIEIGYLPFEAEADVEGTAVLDKNNYAGTTGGGGAGMMSFLGQEVNGTWTLDFMEINKALGGTENNLSPLKNILEDGEITDVLFVIDFGAKYNK